MSEIEIRDVSKVFATPDGPLVTALDHVNITIDKGDIFGIIGMSGAGKSTLVRCLNFLEVPTDGDVVIQGTSLKSLTEKQLREKRTKISMIFQSFNLLMQKTVIDNVAFPLRLAKVKKHEAHEKAIELLRIVGLEDKANNYPSQLSGGQQQRVAIARALASDPEILLCDEATSALDPATTSQILKLLKEINQTMGITIVIITHQMSVIQDVCQHVAILEHGRVQECGEVAEIFKNPKSEAGRRLIQLETETQVVSHLSSYQFLRIVFDEHSAYEPIIANIAMKFQRPVNILEAHTTTIDGKAFGDMIIGLSPGDNSDILDYLESLGLSITEVTFNG
ncbi:MAG: methionine ABC transporter ATP-binding protein [Erysipelotrichaceae bacterium]|nr:methionine ABC transporter ATP-binding protein [Erysipelotrichaceae bacterium]